VTSINELVRGVAIALGQSDVKSCWALDADRNGDIAVGEIVRAAKVAMGPCRHRLRSGASPPNILGRWSGWWNAPNTFGGTGGEITIVVTQEGGALKATGAIRWYSDPTGLLQWTGSADGTIEDGIVRFSFDNLVGSGRGEVDGSIITAEGRIRPPLLTRSFRRGRGFSFTGRFVDDHMVVGAFEVAKSHVGAVSLQRVS
jgi:hypothetical protein